MNFRLLFVLFITLSLVSCRSKKGVLYFQNSEGVTDQQKGSYELKIQSDDLLYISVSSIDDEAVKIFNDKGDLYDEKNSNIINYNNNNKVRGYLVDSNGDIEFPVLGKLHVLNLTKTSLVELLREKLSVYVKDPVIKVRFLNFKVTVIGESTGGARTITFDTDKVSLPQLMAEVKDMSLQSKRENVVVLRDVDGVKTINRVDLTQADIINSPFYYLDQNDVVYIEPRKNKIDSTALPPALFNAAAVISLAVSMVLLVQALK